MAGQGRLFKVAAAEAAGSRAPSARRSSVLAWCGPALLAVALLGQGACGARDAGDLSYLYGQGTGGATGGSGGGPSGGGGNGAGGNGAGGFGSGGGGPSSSSSGGPQPDPPPICVNELMSDNETALVTASGATPDWIELHNPTDMNVSLGGWWITNDKDNPKLHALPMGLIIPAKGYMILFADGSPDLGADHLSFQLNDSGGVVGLFAPNGQGNVTLYPALAADQALSRIPDCCPTEDCIVPIGKGTPGGTNKEQKPVTVIALLQGSSYLYWDNGSVAANWADPGFDDSGWEKGTAPLGYGDPHIVTDVGYGPSQQMKYVTTWFRTTFDIKEVATITFAELLLMRDDGARAFLNGVEVARSNLPSGAISADTLAESIVQGGEETSFYNFPIDPKLFFEGTNWLAIEVHQAVENSSDLGIDAQVSLVQLQ